MRMADDCPVSPYLRYLKTETSFIKHDLPDCERRRRKDGSVITRQWIEERLYNEATALRLVAEKTTIPVPKVIGVGKDDNGLAYIETELLPGIVLEKIKDQCWMQECHVKEGPCEQCSSIAKKNTSRFIIEEVLPQLGKLRHTTTGLDGFLLPPPWILEYDKRTYWKPNSTNSTSYVFCHGDLAAHNIMIDPKSLNVVGIFDWEHAGYFPPEFLKVWSVDRQSYWDYFRDIESVKGFIAHIDV